MDIVFGPDGNFDEVYLYEELMEADLHAIVRPSIDHLYSFQRLIRSNVRHLLPSLLPDSFRPAPLGRALPVIHLSDALRLEVYPFG